MKNSVFSIQLTPFAADRIRYCMKEHKYINKSNLKFRIYIIGGGCGGFQYKFILDDQISDDDYVIKSNGVTLIVDSMSFQYLVGGVVDYREELSGSKFVMINPNAKITCSCGSSFSI
ncbi:iron sulfur cluster insertion protein [Candidatus Blochmanniella vafra str. BVAF]|uniref:Iron-sulfur cluster insertion protein ErpA n=1 Tax=Blochmanniella vafra (strain BVAF) TaxID=859654 RepID=E8Q5R6_BLOVB|nr:iron-sulfur cluster insertion protein ErpA [Candidatus Blochmannia vafer]ADV33563.1 iron sulfur cluster insertion protein [Candidatus Blochmannia vafer str. BVAF]